MIELKVENPHWVGDYPAWDLTLTDGQVHKDVTAREIRVALNALYRRGKIGLYDTYIDVVRRCHMNWYNQYHTATICDIDHLLVDFSEKRVK